MHDYDPQWDYEVIGRDALDPEERDVLAQAEADARARLLPALGLPSMTVFIVKQGGFGRQAIGRYVDGTSSDPVVGVDLAGIRAAARRWGVDWRPQVAATLAHELAHAAQEAAGVREDEGDAERFARAYVMDDCVDASVLGLDDAGAVPALRG